MDSADHRRGPESNRSNASTVRATVSRYDLVLAAIPVAFALALVASAFLSVPLRTALGTASGVGALAMLDGLFRNPPRVGSGSA